MHQKLAKDLRERNIDVWIADEQIKPGDSISKKINEGLTSSQWSIFLVSTDSLKPSFFYKELELALDVEQRRERPFVIPAFIKGDQPPELLKDKAYADFRGNYDIGFNKIMTVLKRLPQD